jgi:hypothetical protein
MIMVITPACYVEGTLIKTERGNIPVELLREGDLLVTSAGTAVAMQQLWRRHIVIAACTDPVGMLPIRIKAGALAFETPSTDLRVSADHALFLDGVFVPAGKLVNGGTIVVDEVVQVTYYHIECDQHEILVANGAFAESYMDVGNRTFFANAGVTDLKPTAPHAAPRERLAAPWATNEAVKEIFANLIARAVLMGYNIVSGTEAVHASRQPKQPMSKSA